MLAPRFVPLAIRQLAEYYYRAMDGETVERDQDYDER